MAVLTLESDPVILEELRGIRAVLERLTRVLETGAERSAAAPGGWMTVQEVKDYLRVSKATIINMANDGRLERRYFGDRIPRYRVKETVA